MVIHLRLLGFFQMMLGRMYDTVQLEEPATLEDLWNHLVSAHPQLQEEDMSRIAGMAVNGCFAGRSTWKTVPLSPEDRVDLLSQMGGG